jgi:alpha-amylase/alpha-mannosidase (GH57 family)
MKEKLQFIFGIHCHQPVGNYDHVIDSLTTRCYFPFLEAVREQPFFKMNVHFSGVLLSWLDKRRPEVIELLAELVQTGQVELLTGGFYEPVLAAIPREDRLRQIEKMQAFIAKRFDYTPKGVWLTERVWEPQVAEDLINAGIEYVIVDDRHFLVSGFDRKDLHAYYLTEAEGKPIAVFPIDERLRYLIPFEMPERLIAYLEQLHEARQPMAIYIDDGEKLGAWPGTHKWVYEDGWLKGFFEAVKAATDTFMKMATFSEIIESVPASGLAYLPVSSYVEMEEWALPASHVERIEALKIRLGPDWKDFSPHIRGSHWRNFFVKYPESNLLHKKMLFLRNLAQSKLSCDPEIIDHLLAAQCNDAYWHGVFGGLYLPHLRHALWEHLISAEHALRKYEGLAIDTIDMDFDGSMEICAHSAEFSAIIKPCCGGQLVEFSDFRSAINLLNTLTRYKESYHIQHTGTPSAENEETNSIESIHDIKKDAGALTGRINFDLCRRGGLINRFFLVTGEDQAPASLDDIGNFANRPFLFSVDGPRVTMTREGCLIIDQEEYPLFLKKSILFSGQGSLAIEHELENRSASAVSSVFGIEYNWFPPSMATGKGAFEINDQPASFEASSTHNEVVSVAFKGEHDKTGLSMQFPVPVSIKVLPVHTVYQTEKGFEKVLQAVSVMPFWPVDLSPGEQWRVAMQIFLNP